MRFSKNMRSSIVLHMGNSAMSSLYCEHLSPLKRDRKPEFQVECISSSLILDQ